MGYVLGAAIIAAIGVIFFLALKLASSVDDKRKSIELALASGKEQLAAERVIIGLTKERDDALVEAATAKKAAAEAKQGFEAAQASLATLMKEEGAHVVEKIRSATPDDARALLRDLMSAPLPGLPGAPADGGAAAPETDRSAAVGVPSTGLPGPGE